MVMLPYQSPRSSRWRDLPWHSATCRGNEAHYGRMNPGPQTQVDEIAPDIFRMSTWVPDITEHGFTLQPVPSHRRRADVVPHRAATAVPAGVGGRESGH